jgi:hypothetical protein
MTEKPLSKGKGSGKDARLLKPWPFMWRALDFISAAFIPSVLMAAVVGFESAVVVTVFNFTWEIIR